MPPPRVGASALVRHLVTETPNVRRTVRALRSTILRAAPHAAEAFKFHVLSYYLDDAYFKSIGGNICMIEVKRGRVLLSLIRGAEVPDPQGLMFGTGKFKRFVEIPSADVARSRPVAALIRAAAKRAAESSFG